MPRHLLVYSPILASSLYLAFISITIDRLHTLRAATRHAGRRRGLRAGGPLHLLHFLVAQRAMCILPLPPQAWHQRFFLKQYFICPGRNPLSPLLRLVSYYSLVPPCRISIGLLLGLYRPLHLEFSLPYFNMVCHTNICMTHTHHTFDPFPPNTPHTHMSMD